MTIYFRQIFIQRKTWSGRTNRCLTGHPRKEGNTGFYYARNHKRNQPINMIQTIMKSTLARCDRQQRKKGAKINAYVQKFDDQTMFWEDFWKSANRSHAFQTCHLSDYLEALNSGNNAELFGASSSSSNRNNNMPPSQQLHYCCMDPYYYPVGHVGRNAGMMTIGPHNKNPITYHANYCKGKDQKILKLVHSRSDHYGWNESRILRQ
mmetsp:Transcript_13652/g.20130  ORF Transcript_13652/g.20130 Transcript_13652/m.20130 type:complete len:207 (+) Transcript_13652:278-898(+)